MTKTQEDFDRARATGASAIALTVDSAMGTNRHRSWRFGVNGRGGGPADFFSWDTYTTYTNMTDLPVILKGVQTVEDVREAVAHGVPAVILSNVRLITLFCLPFSVSFTCMSTFTLETSRLADTHIARWTGCRHCTLAAGGGRRNL